MRPYRMLFVFILFFCFFLQGCHPKVKSEQLPNQATSDPNINAQVGKLFLAKNKTKRGITTLPSGLQYAIIKTGLGEVPSVNDLVTVFYQGRFINGQIFDDQHAASNPVTLRVSSVIPGWQEALRMMQPGSVWVLFVPPNLAYGEHGVPGVIGPNQTLVFYVHLLAVKKQ